MAERPYLLVFAGEDYEERGGWDDFLRCDFDAYDLEAAKQAAREAVTSPAHDWAHVVDLDRTGDPEIVYVVRNGHDGLSVTFDATVEDE